jgi:DNA ligase 1
MQYARLAEVYERLEATPKRLEKTRILSDFLSNIKQSDLRMVIQLIQGRLFPMWDDRKIGVASRIVMKAIQLSSGASIEKVEACFQKQGDLGTAARELLSNKSQSTLFSSSLTVAKVFSNLKSLCEMEGAGTVDRKVKLIAELLSSANPNEGQYIVRTVLEDLRVGAGQGVLRDAIIWANFPKELGLAEGSLDVNEKEKYALISERVQGALDLTLDFGMVAEILKEKGIAGLSKISLEPGRPVMSMLFQKAKNIEDAFVRVGRPAAFEYKYDGFRLQIHKSKERITLFTRRQEDVTAQFPDVVHSVKGIVAKSFILDAEAAAYKAGKYQPFQSISQRIRRKYGIVEMAEKFPVEVNVFDILFLDGSSMISEPFRKRRQTLKGMIKEKKGSLVLSRMLITDSDEKARDFYDDALKAGNEGVMAKSLDAIYKPGSRVGFGVKVKPVMDSLDLVIVSAEWGEGKRSRWLTSFTVACQDSDGNLREIGRVSTGLKELASEGTSFEDMTRLLEPLIEGKGKIVRVKPEVVVELNFEEVQKSPTYSSGYALRFPRFVRLRDDRGLADVDTLETIEGLYGFQRNR